MSRPKKNPPRQCRHSRLNSKLAYHDEKLPIREDDTGIGGIWCALVFKKRVIINHQSAPGDLRNVYPKKPWHQFILRSDLSRIEYARIAAFATSRHIQADLVWDCDGRIIPSVGWLAAHKQVLVGRDLYTVQLGLKGGLFWSVNFGERVIRVRNGSVHQVMGRTSAAVRVLWEKWKEQVAYEAYMGLLRRV